MEYLPEFRYFKIAINEIPKRELVKIRNAVSAIFYVENISTADIEKNRKELVSLLSAVLKKDGAAIVNAITERIYKMHNLPATATTIKTIEDLTEVMSMWETNVKKWEKQVFKKGIERGAEKRDREITEKMIRNGMSNSDIRKITGISFSMIERMRRQSPSSR